MQRHANGKKGGGKKGGGKKGDKYYRNGKRGAKSLKYTKNVLKSLNGKKGEAEKAKLELKKGVIPPTPESAFWSWTDNPLF